MDVITSIQNEKVKDWRKLQQRKYRQRTEAFLIEGAHLIEEAIKSNWIVTELIVSESTTVPTNIEQIAINYVSEAVFQQVTQTESPQGIAAVVKVKKQKDIVGSRLLFVDAVQDPGNLGTLIRTADAAGFAAVVLGKGTVDMYNDKVIRATQGSLFHIPILQADLKETMRELQGQGYVVVASALEKAEPYTTLQRDEKMCLIVGNEGAGIQKELIIEADHIVKIPIYGKAESLNVSVAAGILMYALVE
ncbi:TrmH family RNA methyltransferase [Virgibacillus soli]|uniref:RNA methyltransferase n=1 Tax=Paracerasibacillus soli TaxID=480284 RepID=A0ABU5CQX3_9BACI|nr:RNA methyltransferase [Virgibacillus soli]MDY0408620.1 RNA methyltransferase [Virgibacillus soli]